MEMLEDRIDCAQCLKFLKAYLSRVGVDGPRLPLFPTGNQTPNFANQKHKKHDEKTTANKLSAIFEPPSSMEWWQSPNTTIHDDFLSKGCDVWIIWLDPFQACAEALGVFFHCHPALSFEDLSYEL